MATVIQLPRRPEAIEDEIAEHVRFLQRRHGDRWPELPETSGRPLLRAEALFADAPITISSRAPAADACRLATSAVGPAAAIGSLVEGEGDVLGHALASRVLDLPMSRLSAIAEAVLGLGAVPRASAGWARPAHAHAADVVLTAHGDCLRESAPLHQAVYQHFTERVWEVPERLLQRGRLSWRPLSRRHLRRALAASSRTGHVPEGTADLVLLARASRARSTAIAPLLATHLGDHDHGPLTDVDAALASLRAVRGLQAALAERLDPDRLHGLLASDAFRDEAVLEPARNVRAALAAWTADVARLGGADALARTAPDLALWSTRTKAVLPFVEAAISDYAGLGLSPLSLQDLADGLLARERVSDLVAASPPGAAIPSHAGSAP